MQEKPANLPIIFQVQPEFFLGPVWCGEAYVGARDRRKPEIVACQEPFAPMISRRVGVSISRAWLPLAASSPRFQLGNDHTLELRTRRQLCPQSRIASDHLRPSCEAQNLLTLVLVCVNAYGESGPSWFMA